MALSIEYQKQFRHIVDSFLVGEKLKEKVVLSWKAVASTSENNEKLVSRTLLSLNYCLNLSVINIKNFTVVFFRMGDDSHRPKMKTLQSDANYYSIFRCGKTL